MLIHQLFPEPVYFSKLERAFTKEELKTIAQYRKEKLKKNVGNNRTMDSYVLERKSLKNLKEDLYKMVVDYFNKIVCTNNSIIPYITQSWINYTEPNEFHHRHAHSNSYVSGVLYVVANKKVDKIRFWKSSFKVIDLTVAEYNIFNSDNWQYPVQTGDVVLFPSSLKHGVDKKEGTNIRTSLSFNVFFRGTIGNKFNLTELVLE